MIPALVIIAVLSWFFLVFRAFCSFNLIIIGVGGLIAVGCGADDFLFAQCLAFLICGLLINLVTSLKAERSARGRYMVSLFLYGLFMFLKVTMICLIISIPFVSFISAMGKEYREVIVVDCLGHSTGKRVYVDESGKGSDGNRYKKYDDLY